MEGADVPPLTAALRRRTASVTMSLTWLLFAKTANDRRRHAYWKAIALMRRRTVRRRVAAVRNLPTPDIRIPRPAGFLVCRLEDLGQSDAVIAQTRAIADKVNASPGEKPYLLDVPLHDLDPTSPLVQFALHPRVLAPVADYLGMVPRLGGITLLRSLPTAGPPAGSQLFHCDYEDVRQVKIFVHCTETSAANGPLHVIPAGDSQRIRDALGYRYGDEGFRVEDATIGGFVSDDAVAVVAGPPGTIVLVDTSSCFHYGSRLQPGAGERLVVQFQYLTPAAFELAIAPRSRHPAVVRGERGESLAALVLGRT